jgi:4-amino-4-deoxy-L-arabinose transferase-like glycosyltransferase
VCLLIGVIWFIGLGWRPLLSPDEGRYAEIAREMAASGDFVTPRLNGLKYFEKPPLQYWLTALGLQAFGLHDAVVRLVPALYGLGTCVLAGLMLWRRDGRAAGQRATLIAAGCTWIVANGHFVSLDMGLTFWTTMTLMGLYHAVADGHSRRASLLVWIGMAGGFLSKGLVAGVLPVATVLLTALVCRQPRLLTAVRWWPGLPLFVLIVLPWLALVQLRNPGFFEFFFIHEHFQRFTSDVHRRVEPAWFFVPVFLLGGLPWLGHWVAAATRTAAAPPDDTARAQSTADRLLLIWAAFTFGFFSLSGSKLPSYILPMFPALAVWLARRPPQRRGLRAAAAPVLLLAIAVAASAEYLMRASVDADTVTLAAGYLPWIRGACAALACGAIASWWLASRSADCIGGGNAGGAATPSLAALAVGAVLATQCLQWGHATLGERHSARGLTARLLAAEGPIDAQVPFFAVATWDQSLPFYLRRTLTLVDWRDEMDMGLRDEPHRNGPHEAALLARWPSLPRAYALLDGDGLSRWRAAGVPMRVVAANSRRTVVATLGTTGAQRLSRLSPQPAARSQ